MITYGTNPGMVVAVSGSIPERHNDPVFDQALAYMGLTAGAPIGGQPVNVVFIGSCTNGRLSDLRSAAQLLRGHKIARGVRALVVPGSQQVKKAAEAEGLDRIFIAAGAEWRESGCSMCIGMNGDTVAAASTQSAPATATSRAARAPARARCWPALDRRGQRGARPGHRSARIPQRLTTAWNRYADSLAHRGIAVHQYRHRPDHTGALSAHHDARRTGQAAVRRLALRRRRGAQARVRAQPPEAAGCAVLVAGRNFGCGSSREHAPWALLDYGFRAVISTEIADIFRSNSLKNGLLPIEVDEPPASWLLEHPGAEVTIDLANTTLRCPTAARCAFRSSALRATACSTAWTNSASCSLEGGEIAPTSRARCSESCNCGAGRRRHRAGGDRRGGAGAAGGRGALRP
jgi:3-isopropylmalate dehydratase small subunit